MISYDRTLWYRTSLHGTVTLLSLGLTIVQTLSLTPNITCGQPAASWSEWAGRGAGAWAGGPSVYTLHYTLARCWSEESPTAGHYNCWSWTINTAHSLLPSVDTSAASWQQCSAVQCRHQTRHGEVNPESTTVYICEVWNTADGWQKCRQQ